MEVDQALDIFWKAYEDCPETRIAGIKSVKQSDLYRHAMESVLTAVDKELAEKYLSMSEESQVIKWEIKHGNLGKQNPVDLKNL